MNEIRTEGGALLRQALDQLQKDLTAAPEEKPRSIAAYTVFSAETGAELGVALRWRTKVGGEWIVSSGLSRRIKASPKPVGVELRLELKGAW